MKEKKNYIDNIPKINDMKWDVSEDGIVEITVENTGFYNTIAQKIFKKPRYSFIKLDEYGSFVWQKNGRTINEYEIGKQISEVPQQAGKEHQAVHEGAATQLYERLSQYFAILERNKYIVFEE